MTRWRYAAPAGAVLLAILVLPWTRNAMETSMWRHMIVQYPLWIIAGTAVCGALPRRIRGPLASWNVKGVSGLTFATIALAVLMVPRVLDLALVNSKIELAKLAALFLIGVALRLSWKQAGPILQFFFFGNAIGMTAIAGMLYMNSPLRLCNAYLLDDQERLGTWLTTGAAVVGVAWFVWIAWILMRRENAYYASVPESSERPSAAEPEARTPANRKVQYTAVSARLGSALPQSHKSLRQAARCHSVSFCGSLSRRRASRLG